MYRWQIAHSASSVSPSSKPTNRAVRRERRRPAHAERESGDWGPASSTWRRLAGNTAAGMPPATGMRRLCAVRCGAAHGLEPCWRARGSSALHGRRWQPSCTASLPAWASTAGARTAHPVTRAWHAAPTPRPPHDAAPGAGSSKAAGRGPPRAPGSASQQATLGSPPPVHPPRQRRRFAVPSGQQPAAGHSATPERGGRPLQSARPAAPPPSAASPPGTPRTACGSSAGGPALRHQSAASRQAQS